MSLKKAFIMPGPVKGKVFHGLGSLPTGVAVGSDRLYELLKPVADRLGLQMTRRLCRHCHRQGQLWNSG